MWHLIAFHGLHRGEACGRPWPGANPDRHSLTVTGQLVQGGREVQVSAPKRDSGFPVVALDDDTVGVLERHRKQQEADRAADIHQSVLSYVGKNAAEATAELIPLQRKAEAEEARPAGRLTPPLTHRSRKPPHGIPAV